MPSTIRNRLRDRVQKLFQSTRNLKERKGLEFILKNRILKEHFYFLLTIIALPLIYRPLLSLPYEPGGRLRDLLPFSFRGVYLQIEITFFSIFVSFVVLTFILAVLLRFASVRHYLFETYNTRDRVLSQYLFAFTILAILLYLLQQIPLPNGLVVTGYEAWGISPNIELPSLIIGLILAGFVISYPLQMTGILLLMIAAAMMNNIDAWYPFPIAGTVFQTVTSLAIGSVVVGSLIVSAIVEIGFLGLAILHLRSMKWVDRLEHSTGLVTGLFILTVTAATLEFGFGRLNPSDLFFLVFQRPVFFVGDIPTTFDVARVIFASFRVLVLLGLILAILLKLSKEKPQRFFLLWLLYLGSYLFLIAEPFSFEFAIGGLLSSIVIVPVVTLWTLTSVIPDLLDRRESIPFIRNYNAPLIGFLLVSASSLGNWIDLFSRAQRSNPPLLTWRIELLLGVPLVCAAGVWIVYRSYLRQAADLKASLDEGSARLVEVFRSFARIVMNKISFKASSKQRDSSQRTKQMQRQSSKQVIVSASKTPQPLRSFKFSTVAIILLVILLSGSTYSVYSSMTPEYYHEPGYKKFMRVDFAYYHEWGNSFGFYSRLTDVYHNRTFQGTPWVLLVDTRRPPGDDYYNITDESITVLTTPFSTEVTDGDILTFDAIVKTPRNMSAVLYAPPLLEGKAQTVNGTMSFHVTWFFDTEHGRYAINLRNQTVSGYQGMYYGIQPLFEIWFYEGDKPIDFFGTTVWYLPFKGQIVREDNPNIQNGELFTKYSLENATRSDKLVLHDLADNYIFDLGPTAIFFSPSLSVPASIVIGIVVILHGEYQRFKKRRPHPWPRTSDSPDAATDGLSSMPTHTSLQRSQHRVEQCPFCHIETSLHHN